MKSEAVKALQTLMYLHRKDKVRYYSDSSANGLTRCIIDFVNLQDNCFAYRVNNTGIYDPKKGIFRKSNTIKGIADVTAIKNGVCWQIEVKIGKDRLSKDQKLFQDLVNAANGIYIIVKSFEDFLEQWQGSKILEHQQLNLFNDG